MAVKNWFVYCNKCGKPTTIAVRPGMSDFVDKVHCSICNSEIDASRGVVVDSRTVIREPNNSIDLLAI